MRAGERLATPVELELIRLVRERMDTERAMAEHAAAWELEQEQWWDGGCKS